MGLFRKSSSTKASTDNPVDPNMDTLYVHLRTDGYSSRVVAADGKPRGDFDTGNLSFFREGESRDQLEASISELVGQISGRKAHSIGKIYLISDGLPTLVRDGMAEAFNDRQLHTAGQQLLHANEVTWGQTRIAEPGNDQHSKRARSVALVDARPLRHILASFGQHSAKISALVPCEQALIQQAYASKSQPYMGIYLAAHETRVVMVNTDTGALLVRTLPYGVASLAEAVADVTGIDAEDALDSFRTRPVLNKLGLPIHDNNSLTPSPIENALLPVVRELAHGIRGSVEYFRDQIGSGEPELLRIYGETARLKGVEDWLQKLTGIKARPSVQSLLQLYAQDSGPSELNLLQGCESSLITVGKVAYSFDKGTFKPTNQVQQAVATRPSSSDSRQTRRGATRDRRNSGSHRSRQGSRSPRQVEGGLSGLISKLFNASADDGTQGVDRDQKVDNAWVYYALSVFMFASLFYYGYDEYEKLEKRHKYMTFAYADGFEQVQKSRKALSNIGFRKQAVVETADKVLWTEKFLALGNHLNERLWITDLYLGEATRTLINRESVVTKRLVIEGAALPSSDGHIAEIARFMGALEADQTNFMGDFSEVSFAGAHTDEEDNENVVRFTLIAWYDENKRQHQESEEISTDKPSLGQTMKAVGKHNNQALKAIPGLGGQP